MLYYFYSLRLYDSDIFNAFTVFGMSMHKAVEQVVEVILVMLLLSPLMSLFFLLYATMEKMG